MSNLIKFPLKNKHNQPTELGKLEKKITSMQKMMDLKYKHIAQAYEKLIQMEMECTNLEDKYDATLQDYALRHGAENIKVEWMDYTKKLEFTLTGEGDIIMSFKLDNENSD